MWCVILDPFDLPTRVVGPFETEAEAIGVAEEIYDMSNRGAAVVPLVPFDRDNLTG